MTLNSIDWNDKILVRCNKTSTNQVIEIGKFIDELLKDNIKKVQYLGNNKKDEMGDVQYLDTKDKEYFIPSVDEDGVVSWKKIEAVTKHLPINKDGTSTLVKIKTRLGREVTATKAKSFLTRINNKIVPIRGDEIKVGTMLPIMKDFPILDNHKWDDNYDTTVHFPKNDCVYGSEIEKTREYRKECTKNGEVQGWFTRGKSIIFETPHQYTNGLTRILNGKRKQEYLKEYIYPSNATNTVALIPEKIKLDKTFGFIVGAYIAEGCNSQKTIIIANNDENYRKAVKEFADKYHFGYKEKSGYKKLSTKLQYQSELYSVLLSKMMGELCGNLAHGKKIPDFAYTANDEFVIGLLDGYFCGDGCVSKDCDVIIAVSTSNELIIGLSTLLTRLGIFSKVNKRQLIHNENANVPQNYPVTELTFRNGNIRKFHEKVKLTIEYKQNRLDLVENKKFVCESELHDIIPCDNLTILSALENTYDGRTVMYKNYKKNLIHRDKLEYLLKNNLDKMTQTEKNILVKAVNSNIYYDDIVSIEEVKPSHEYVYDFTVADTKNFCLANSLMVRDSFHHSGISTLSSQLGGVIIHSPSHVQLMTSIFC